MKFYTKLHEENKGAGGSQPPINIIMPKEEKKAPTFEEAKEALRKEQEAEKRATEEFNKKVEERAKELSEQKELERKADEEKKAKEKLFKSLEKRKDIIEKFKKNNIDYKNIPLDQLQSHLSMLEFNPAAAPVVVPEGGIIPASNSGVTSISNAVDNYMDRKYKKETK